MSITITKYRVLFVIKLFWSNGFLILSMRAHIIIETAATSILLESNDFMLTLDLLPNGQLAGNYSPAAHLGNGKKIGKPPTKLHFNPATGLIFLFFGSILHAANDIPTPNL